MAIFKTMKQNFTRARARVKSAFSIGKSNKVMDGPSNTPEKLAADGNVKKITDDFDLDPETITTITEIQTTTTYPDGQTVHTVERSIVERVAAEPRAAVPATEFMGEQAPNSKPDALLKALEESNSRAGMKTKAMAIQGFIIVGLATAGLAYFFISASERKKCIDNVFLTYPMFSSRKVLEQKLEQMGDKCVTEQSELCANINKAYAALEACDNTLLRNIVGEMLDIGSDGVDWTLKQGAKGVDFLGDMVAKVWPIVLIAFAGLIVVGVIAFLVLRSSGQLPFPVRGSEGRGSALPSPPAFGKASAWCTGRRGTLRRRCA
jgi:hypothetical protein